MNRSPFRIALLTILAAGLGGCAYHGTPVPITGDTRLLAGEWEGTYESEATGRSGIITFALKAGTDSAFGDVLMIPRRPEYPQVPGAEPGNLPRTMTRLLRISFVWCSGGTVTGRLDPYEDPDTQERIQTVFEGQLNRDTFAGSFESVYATSGRRVNGTWTVTRKSGTGPQVAPRPAGTPRSGPACRPPR